MQAAANANLREREFWEISPAEFVRIMRAKDIKEQNELHRWRTMYCAILAPHTKKGHEITPEKVIYLPLFDKKQAPDLEELEEFKWKFRNIR